MIKKNRHQAKDMQSLNNAKAINIYKKEARRTQFKLGMKLLAPEAWADHDYFQTQAVLPDLSKNEKRLFTLPMLGECNFTVVNSLNTPTDFLDEKLKRKRICYHLQENMKE